MLQCSVRGVGSGVALIDKGNFDRGALHAGPVRPGRRPVRGRPGRPGVTVRASRWPSTAMWTFCASWPRHSRPAQTQAWTAGFGCRCRSPSAGPCARPTRGRSTATVAIDFNRSHATNPLWPGHARFHLVWQSSTVVLLSLVGVVLIWHRGPDEAERFYLAVLLAALSPLGFLTAFSSRRLFAGTLSDPNGIRPAHLRLFGSSRTFDVNLAAVVGALASLLTMIWIFKS